MRTTAFDRFAGLSAILAGLGGVAYGVAFVIVGDKLLYSVLLMLGGLLSTVVYVALYSRLRDIDLPLATWALLLGVVGALGSVSHGGFDLAVVLHPPAAGSGDLSNLPIQTDPRGLLTFGFAGLGVLVFAALMSRSPQFPKALGNLGYLLGALLIVIYLGRLIILDPTNTVVRIALLAGVVVNTFWFMWLGVALRREQAG